MANTTFLRGECIAPFFDASRFPSKGGYVDGRFCAPISGLPGTPLCCLPCPIRDWTYPDSFRTYSQVAEWMNVAGMVLMVFMLVSYAVLPTQKTRSHYLSICLVISIMMIAIAFIIPLGARPQQCYNEITPNDMYSSSECAWSGAFLLAGGLSATLWIFIRALSMNLQICWDIVPGRRFFYFSQAFGWGVPALLFTAALTATGVSFRFGSACLINHENSLKDFWGPMLGFAGAAGVLQLSTFIYCIKVYLKSLFSDQAEASTQRSDAELPSYTSSVRTQTARAVFRRLKKVLWLQWRGITIVSIILVDVIFFSIVFVFLDDLQVQVLHDWEKVEPWLLCLAFHPDDKDQCLSLVSKWVVNEPTVVAVLFLLSLTGIQCFVFLTRPSIFPAWAEYLREKFTPRRHEFVSLDATPDIMRSRSNAQLLKYDHGHRSTTFEMQKPQLRHLPMDLDSKSPDTVLSSPDDTYRSPLHISGESSEIDERRISPELPPPSRGKMPPEYVGRVTPTLGTPSPPAVVYNSASLRQQSTDYFTEQRRAYSRQASSDRVPDYNRVEGSSGGTTGVRRANSQDERRYQPPDTSFSAPITPSRQSSVRSVAFAADPRETYSRGGLALNPPSEAGESEEDLSAQQARPESFTRR